MATIADRILEAIRDKPLDDDQLVKRLAVSTRQSINQAARRLQAQGLLSRSTGPAGKIVNSLPDARPPQPSPPRLRVVATGMGRITEDEVKEAVRVLLVEQGFEVSVAWGRTRGIDIDAKHPDGRRHVIEAKAEVGQHGPQQVNYFLGMLGELIQRMDDPAATYGIALPDNRQYRGLVSRLPSLARDRLGLTVFWVSRGSSGRAIAVMSQP